jgi:hypothetical protein
MRFMMLMIPNIPDQENWMPAAEDVARMGRYNEELSKAGVLLALDGLHPPASGARVSYGEGGVTVKDGPFAEAKEVIGGYWVIDVSSREEAVEWARRIPGAPGDVVEVRQVFEMADFPEDVQAAAGDFQLP